MTDQITELPPTIQKLETSKDKENLSGSPLTKRKVLFGKEFYFYADGSVLVIDPMRQEYHFITQEGKKKGRGLRKSAEELIRNEQRLEQMRLLGEGKGGYSKVYEFNTPAGPIAVKTTDRVGFFLKEFAEESSKNAGINIGRGSKKIIQKMSLADTIRLFKKLDQAGICRPEFYGFSVRRNPKNDEIQEFQFMEKIDRPTVESILEAYMDAKQKGTDISAASKFPYVKFLKELATKYFRGDYNDLMKSLIISFFDFITAVKQAVPDIGDLEADNIFLAGYNEQTGKCEFILIDPIEEQVLIKPIRKQEADHHIINPPINNILDENNIKETILK